MDRRVNELIMFSEEKPRLYNTKKKKNVLIENKISALDNIVTAFGIIAAQMLIQLERLQQSLGYVCQFAARKCLCCVTYVCT